MTRIVNIAITRGRIKRTLLFFGFTLINITAFAGTQKYTLDESQRIEGLISGSEANRIKVEGDRIVEVIGLGEGWAVESDERLGQVFIKARDGEAKAVFTIVTEKGKTQDFSLKVKAQTDGQIILLQNKDVDGELNSKLLGSKHVRHDEIITLIKAARKLSADKNPTTYTEGDLEISAVNEKRIGRYLIEVWQVSNKGQQLMTLAEKHFANNEPLTAAIMLERTELSLGEVTKLYKVNYYE